jgi:hypothetical protein
VSDPEDWLGQGKTYSGAGDGSVKISPFTNSSLVELNLTNGSNGDQWRTQFGAPDNARLTPGIYDPVASYALEVPGAAVLSVSGNSSGCNQSTGKFSVEELEVDPVVGLTRFSATFEHHCEGAEPALRGVVNYQAKGVIDPTLEPAKTIPLEGAIFRVAYDATSDTVYGLDATNRSLAKIDLPTGSVTRADVLQVPSDACVDAERGRLFVVTKGSSYITEFRTSDLSRVRDITWSGTDSGASETQFKIYCAPERLYVTDGAWAPALFTVEDLDGPSPSVVDHRSTIEGVGGLTLGHDGQSLYYWEQVGWSGGQLNTAVHRILTSDLSEADMTHPNMSNFYTEPLSTPILLDETRGLVFVKNKVFDAKNLETLVYTLSSTYDSFDSAFENTYALDPQRGLLSTKSYVYELGHYDVVTPTLVADADQLFFDSKGKLWFFSAARSVVSAQVVTH